MISFSCPRGGRALSFANQPIIDFIVLASISCPPAKANPALSNSCIRGLFGSCGCALLGSSLEKNRPKACLVAAIYSGVIGNALNCCEFKGSVLNEVIEGEGLCVCVISIGCWGVRPPAALIEFERGLG